MARSKSSHRWLREHFDDPYVQRAQREGWRSRSVFKLQEIDNKDRILRPGMVVVDLGAAPGGWSQYASRRMRGRGRIVALDMLSMDPIEGVAFLQGDFGDQSVMDRLLREIGDTRVDLVMSDIAPNMSGIAAVDQPRAMHMAELTVGFASQVLGQGGDLLLKVFQGEGFDGLLADLRRLFRRVVSRKPKASRPRSSELYLLARNCSL